MKNSRAKSSIIVKGSGIASIMKWRYFIFWLLIPALLCFHVFSDYKTYATSYANLAVQQMDSDSKELSFLEDSYDKALKGEDVQWGTYAELYDAKLKEFRKSVKEAQDGASDQSVLVWNELKNGVDQDKDPDVYEALDTIVHNLTSEIGAKTQAQVDETQALVALIESYFDAETIEENIPSLAAEQPLKAAQEAIYLLQERKAIVQKAYDAALIQLRGTMETIEALQAQLDDPTTHKIIADLTYEQQTIDLRLSEIGARLVEIDTLLANPNVSLEDELALGTERDELLSKRTEWQAKRETVTIELKTAYDARLNIESRMAAEMQMVSALQAKQNELNEQSKDLNEKINALSNKLAYIQLLGRQIEALEDVKKTFSDRLYGTANPEHTVLREVTDRVNGDVVDAYAFKIPSFALPSDAQKMQLQNLGLEVPEFNPEENDGALLTTAQKEFVTYLKVANERKTPYREYFEGQIKVVQAKWSNLAAIKANKEMSKFFDVSIGMLQEYEDMIVAARAEVAKFTSAPTFTGAMTTRLNQHEFAKNQTAWNACGSISTKTIFAGIVGAEIAPLESLATTLLIIAIVLFVFVSVFVLKNVISARFTHYTIVDNVITWKTLSGKQYTTFTIQPDAEVVLSRSFMGRIFGYGTLIVTMGNGEAGGFAMRYVRRVRRANRLLRGHVQSLRVVPMNPAEALMQSAPIPPAMPPMMQPGMPPMMQPAMPPMMPPAPMPPSGLGMPTNE